MLYSAIFVFCNLALFQSSLRFQLQLDFNSVFALLKIHLLQTFSSQAS